MKKHILATGLAFMMVLSCGCGPKGHTRTQKIESANRMVGATLQEAYRRDPELKPLVEGAEGYAVFSNIGTQFIILATGNGYGVVHDNRTGENTHMRMLQLGGGLGLAIKDYRAVFVFHRREAMTNFIESGWGAEGQAEASAKAEDKGGSAGMAQQIADGVSVYQFTQTGIALQATISGMKFWKDEDLN
jgi:lipid-binding SYLF domain-containing protein